MNLSKCIVSTSIALSSLVANADNTTELPRYKFAVFNDAGTVEQLRSTPLKSFIQEIDKMENKRASYTKFEKLSGLCLAYVKQYDYPAAEKSCDRALAVAKKPALRGSREVLAYAYNNRGVVRALAHNDIGAMDDFQSAVNNYNLKLAVSNLENVDSVLNDS